MRKILKHFVRFMCCVAVVMMAVSVVPTSVFATEDDDEDGSYSLYDVTTALMEYVSESKQPQGDGDKAVLGLDCISGGVNVGNAGAFVGYAKKGWLASLDSSSSSSNSYRSFERMPINSDGGTTHVIRDYVQYGYLLGELGLDTSSGGTFSFMSAVSGAIIKFLFDAAIVVPKAFGVIGSVLKGLNPFQLFSYATAAQVNGENVLGQPQTAFTTLVTAVSNWYDALSNLSWAVFVPIFFVMLVVWLLLFKSVDKGKKIKKYIIRIAFIAIGIPLLGVSYTGVLNYLGDMSDGSNTAAVKIVASTFCDFETWARNCRLGVPGDAVIAYEAKDNTKSGESVSIRPTFYCLMMTRNTCYVINRDSGAIPLAGDSPFTIAAGGNGTETTESEWNTNALASDDANVSNDAIQATNDMLDRYMKNVRFEGSTYASDVSDRLSRASLDGGTAVSKGVNDMFEKGGDSDTYRGNTEIFTSKAYGGGYNVYYNGTLTVNTDTGVYSDPSFRKSESLATQSWKDGGDYSHGLSTISMYNYLNTSFADDGLKFYSSEDASSSLVRKSHTSVSLVGSGLGSFLYWCNCAILLACLGFIGFFYCFGLVFANIKRTIHTISSVPFAMLGSVHAIAKVVTYTIVMILEVIATVFLYNLVVDLLMTLSNLVEQPFATIMSQFGGSSGLVEVSLLLSCIIYVWFLVMVIRLRKSVVKSLSEAAEDIINKFMDVSGMPSAGPKQPGLLAKGAGAVATGAGMAMGQRLMNGKDKVKGVAGGDVAGSKDGSDGTNGTNGGGGSDGPNDGSGGDASAEHIGTKDQKAIEAKQHAIDDKHDGQKAIEGGSTPIGLPGPTGSNVDDGGSASNTADSHNESDDEAVATKCVEAGGLDTGTTDAKTDDKLADATGQTSVTGEESRDEAMKENRKDAMKKVAVDGAATAVHAGEAVAKGSAGDVGGAVKSGVKAVHGASQMKNDMKDAQHGTRNGVRPQASRVTSSERGTSVSNAGGATQNGQRTRTPHGNMNLQAGVQQERNNAKQVGVVVSTTSDQPSTAMNNRSSDAVKSVRTNSTRTRASQSTKRQTVQLSNTNASSTFVSQMTSRPADVPKQHRGTRKPKRTLDTGKKHNEI